MDDRSQFVRTVAGEASNAARIRMEFADWLQRHFVLAAERLSDVVLAVNEALANAVEHGCSNAQDVVALAAAYDDHTDTLTVTLSDRGQWPQAFTQQLSTPGPHLQRGRGVALMRLLTDDTSIDTSEHGTDVSLVWAPLSRTDGRHDVDAAAQRAQRIGDDAKQAHHRADQARLRADQAQTRADARKSSHTRDSDD